MLSTTHKNTKTNLLIKTPCSYLDRQTRRIGPQDRVVANTSGYDYTHLIMKTLNEKTPSPKEIEKDISEFLSKKFKDNVKIISPVVLHQELALDKKETKSSHDKSINFDLLPEDLIAYLVRCKIKIR